MSRRRREKRVKSEIFRIVDHGEAGTGKVHDVQ